MEITLMKGPDEISLNETMFVIGSGPCLNKVDIKLLKGLNTISLNRQYIAYDDWGFWPKYYLCIDAKLIQKTFEPAILPMMRADCEIERFFILADYLPAASDEFTQTPNRLGPGPHAESKLILMPPRGQSSWGDEVIEKYESCFVDSALAQKRFHRLAETHRLPGGQNHAIDFWEEGQRGYGLHFRGSGGAFAVNLAYALGYKRAIILGVDAKYSSRKESLLAGQDLQHFHPDYFHVDEFDLGKDFGDPSYYLEPWHIIANGGGPGENVLDEYGISRYSSWDLNGYLCSDETFEVISCSPGSIINDLFEYADLEELLKSYEASNEN
jgi:hypothetical protein